jgi:hypothetical protein
MPLNLKPAKPSSYDGKRDSLTVETWLYQVEQYLSLVQVGSPETPINDETKISYASSLFTQTAATWWYMLVQAGSVPGNWENMKEISSSDLYLEQWETNSRIQSKEDGRWNVCFHNSRKRAIDVCYIKGKCVFQEKLSQAFYKQLMIRKLAVILGWQKRCIGYQDFVGDTCCVMSGAT